MSALPDRLYERLAYREVLEVGRRTAGGWADELVLVRPWPELAGRAARRNPPERMSG